MSKQSGATTEQLRHDIDQGRTGDKVRFLIQPPLRWALTKKQREHPSILRSLRRPVRGN